MIGSLRTLDWWKEYHEELVEPSGPFRELVVLRARWSLFACPSRSETNGRWRVCGARLKEFAGMIPMGDDLMRDLFCPVCGFRTQRKVGFITLYHPRDDE